MTDRSANLRLPQGFRIELAHGVRLSNGSILSGGTPSRLIRLSSAGQRAYAELQDGPVRSPASGRLARQLCDYGLANPKPLAPDILLDLTILVPAQDRSAMLARCLESLGKRYPIIVVDDGSTCPENIARVAHHYGAQIVRRCDSGGPAAARNDGLAIIESDFVALIDSDCVAPNEWIDQLGAHFADPAVAAVAPRIRSVTSGILGHYVSSSGSLDQGNRPSRVDPAGLVRYVPAAALLLRTKALMTIARDNEIFAKAMRFGEDVDLVWRLFDEGWTTRYVPEVVIEHHESPKWKDLFVRRFHYGTSAAPLAKLHPGKTPSMVLHPVSLIAIVAAFTRTWIVAGLSIATAIFLRRRRLSDIESRFDSLSKIVNGLFGSGVAVGRWSTQFAMPLLAYRCFVPTRKRQKNLRGRIAAATLLFGPGLTKWFTKRPHLDPVRFVLGQIAEDSAYGTGVLVGSVRCRTIDAVKPRLIFRAKADNRK